MSDDFSLERIVVDGTRYRVHTFILYPGQKFFEYYFPCITLKFSYDGGHDITSLHVLRLHSPDIPPSPRPHPSPLGRVLCTDPNQKFQVTYTLLVRTVPLDGLGPTLYLVGPPPVGNPSYLWNTTVPPSSSPVLYLRWGTSRTHGVVPQGGKVDPRYLPKPLPLSLLNRVRYLTTITSYQCNFPLITPISLTKPLNYIGPSTCYYRLVPVIVTYTFFSPRIASPNFCHNLWLVVVVVLVATEVSKIGLTNPSISIEINSLLYASSFETLPHCLNQNLSHHRQWTRTSTSTDSEPLYVGPRVLSTLLPLWVRGVNGLTRLHTTNYISTRHKLLNVYWPKKGGEFLCRHTLTSRHVVGKTR